MSAPEEEAVLTADDAEDQANPLPDEGAGGDDEEAVKAGLEAEARRMGWRPKDEFKGPEDRWIDAGKFVKNGREVLPIVQANNKALEKAMRDGEAKIARLEKTLADFSEYHSKTEQRAIKAAMRELEARQAQAVEANDLAEVQAVTREITELTVETKAPKPVDDGPAEAQREIDAFKEANPWFDTDEVLTSYARGVRVPDGMSAKEQMKFISEKVKAAFPQKFENPARRQPAPVDGGGSARPTGGKTFNDLPADAKSMCVQFERDIKGFKREQYVKEYFA